MLAVLVLLPAAARLSRPKGAWLTDNELTTVNSVDCLKRRHRGERGGDCGTPYDSHQGDPGSWHIGYFPRYNESICGQVRNATADADVWHNTAEDVQPFCDPDGLLDADQRKEIEKALFDQWASTKVQCNHPGSGRPDEPSPFRVGVAVLRTLPIGEQDESGLETFGTSVLTLWDMDGEGLAAKQDGVAQICSDTAMLVFVAEPYERMVVVAPNCDNICMQRNGESVVTAAKVGWKKDLRYAVLKAIAQTKRVVSRTPEDGTHPFSHLGRDAFFSKWLHSEDVMVEAQQGLLLVFLTCVVLFVLALLRYALSAVIQRTVWDFQKEMEPGYVDDTLRRSGRYSTAAAHFGRAV